MNIHTSRARTAAQKDYLSFMRGSAKEDIESWINDMQSRRLAANTIRQRVSLARSWLGKQEYINLPTRRNIREDKWLNLEQIRAILSIIPNTEKGRHDFVLITALLVTGLRIGQVRTWRWGDFEHKYGFSTTNNKTILPQVILEVLQLVLSKGKDSYLNNMPLPVTHYGEDYIFTATHPRSRICRGRHNLSSIDIIKQPLSPQEINRRIRRYVRLAGLETQGISAESLRRTNKELGENTIINLVQNSLTHRKASPVRWKQIDRDARLHGIGRRSRRV